MSVTVRVPGTTANFGPGFDTLGCAWQLYNYLTFEETGDKLVITGCDSKYANEKNLAFAAYKTAMDAMGLSMPKGLKIDIAGDIPVSRGLGSSAALIAGGIFGASALHGNLLSKDQMLNLASQMEGHPDNAAPAVFGGMVSSVLDDESVVHASWPVSRDLNFTIYIPDFEVETHKARGILPGEYSRADAVFNLSRITALLKGLETGDEKLLSIGMDDKIHEPYRKTLINGYEFVKTAAMENGACGLVISGSGSTMLSVGGDASFAEKMKQILSEEGFSGWKVLSVKTDSEGVVLV